MTKGLLYGIKKFPSDLKNSDLLLLFLAVILAVTSITTVTFFGDRLKISIQQQAAVVLGADAVLRSSSPISSVYLQQAQREGLKTAESISFLSMVIVNEDNLLASIKATSPEYPLRGTLKLRSFNGQRINKHQGAPRQGYAWAEQKLMDQLNIPKGGSIVIGDREFIIESVLDDFPDRNIGFLNFSPTVLVNIADLESMGVILPGSRVLYRQMFAGNQERLDRFLTGLENLPPEIRIQQIENIGQQLGKTLDRSSRFLSLAGLATIIVAAIAAMISSRRFALRNLLSCSLMKTFGASQGFILAALISQLLLMTLLATTIGVALGFAIQSILAGLLEGVFESSLPDPSWQPIWVALLTSTCLIVGTVTPYLQQLKTTQPIRILRNDFSYEHRGALLINGLAMASLMVFLFILLADFTLVMIIILSLFVLGMVLTAMGWLLVKCTALMNQQAGVGWRLGLKNISKRSSESILHIVVFGLSLMVLMVLSETRSDLIDTWKASLPEKTPNHFFFNIQASERNDMANFFNKEIGQDMRFTPLIRGRLLKVNQLEGERQSSQPERFIEREANITWYRELPDNNSVVEGEWWGELGDTILAASLDQNVATSIGITVGDEVIFTAGGSNFKATVTNLRAVEWESFEPNFFFVVSPMIGKNLPQSFITSINIPQSKQQITDDFLSSHPSITSVDLNAVVKQIRTVINKASLAVQCMFFLTFIAGVLALISTILASTDQRRYESALLHTIGAKRSKIFQSVATEFVALGIGAGFVAVLGTMIISGSLATQIFNVNYVPNVVILLSGLFSGAFCIGLVGVFAVRRSVYEPPILTLRNY